MYYIIDKENRLWGKAESKIMAEWIKAGYDIFNKKYHLQIVTKKMVYKPLPENIKEEIQKARKDNSPVDIIELYKQYDIIKNENERWI